MNALGSETNMDRERLDQIFAIVAVVERTGAKKEGDRSVDRGRRPIVPRDPQAGAAKVDCLRAGNDQFDRPHRARRSLDLFQLHRLTGGERNTTAD